MFKSNFRDYKQRSERNTSATVRSKWGNKECLDQMIKRRILEWLCHIAHMPDNRIPRKVLLDDCSNFVHRVVQGEDGRIYIIRQDLKDIGVDEGQW